MSETAQAAASAVQDALTAPKQPLPKIKTICVDTLTAIMKNEVYDDWGDGKKVNYDKWRDYGLALNNFTRALKDDFGFTLVGITGHEGTGKSFGMKTLKPQTNLWFNCDKKICTFKDGSKIYGTPKNPTPYNVIKASESYKGMLEVIQRVIDRGNLDPNPVAFLIAHVDEYKGAGDVSRQRMKLMGNVSKNGLDDMFALHYYTIVTPDGHGGSTYELLTQNTGTNTGRTLEGQHDTPRIPNDFQLIVDSVDNY